MALPDQFLPQQGNTYKGDLGQSFMGRLGSLAQSPEFQRMALGALQGSRRPTGQWVSGGGYNFYAPGSSQVQNAMSGAGEAYLGGKLQDLMQEKQMEREAEKQAKKQQQAAEEYMKKKADRLKELKLRKDLELKNNLLSQGYGSPEEREDARKARTKLESQLSVYKAKTRAAKAGEKILDKVSGMGKAVGKWLTAQGTPKETKSSFQKRIRDFGAAGKTLEDLTETDRRIATIYQTSERDLQNLIDVGKKFQEDKAKRGQSVLEMMVGGLKKEPKTLDELTGDK